MQSDLKSSFSQVSLKNISMMRKQSAESAEMCIDVFTRSNIFLKIASELTCDKHKFVKHV
jgi:hypothetical protein